MANFIFSAGYPHSLLFATKPEHWDLRAKEDALNLVHCYQGPTYSFGELVALRKGEGIARQLKRTSCTSVTRATRIM